MANEFNEKLVPHRYLVNKMEIIFPGDLDTYNVNIGSIAAITIEKDYDRDSFPVFCVSVNIPQVVWYNILQNKTTTKVRIRIDSFEDNRGMLIPNPLIDDVFTIFTNENTPFLDKDLYDKSKITDGSGEHSMTDFRQTYNLYLFNQTSLAGSKKIINEVIKSSDMQTLCSYLLSSSGFSKVLMTKMENTTVYKEIILLPISIIQNILYLEQQYGFYHYGATLFFDFDCVYLYKRKSGLSSANRKAEDKKTLIQVNKSINPYSFGPGSYLDSETKTYILNITKDKVTILNEAMIHDQTGGNKVTMVNTSSGGVKKVDPPTEQVGDGSSRLLYNAYYNPFIDKTLGYRLAELNWIIYVQFSDIDIRALGLNKLFTFKFEDNEIQKKYGGGYRIKKSLFSFIKQGEYFIVSGSSEFTRDK